MEAQLAAFDHERAGGSDVQSLRRQLARVAQLRLGFCGGGRSGRLLGLVYVVVPARLDNLLLAGVLVSLSRSRHPHRSQLVQRFVTRLEGQVDDTVAESDIATLNPKG